MVGNVVMADKLELSESATTVHQNISGLARGTYLAKNSIRKRIVYYQEGCFVLK